MPGPKHLSQFACAYRCQVDLYPSLVTIADSASAAIGVTDLAPFPDEAVRIRSRVASGLHGGLSFTYAHPETASSPRESFPWAASIVVVALPYLREGDGPSDRRSVARFADGDRYEGLRSLLATLALKISDDGYRAEVVFDDNRIIDRAVAIRAGVVWSGKSTMVLTPGAGPWILLGSVVTDAELVKTGQMRRTCGTCDACIPACPTDAIIAPGILDARRCISAVLQRRGVIDPRLRTAIGGRIYGCDECLTACPPGKQALASLERAGDGLRPEVVLSLSDGELEVLVEHWYIPSRRMRFVRRNALVALGNTGSEPSLALLERYLCDPDALLRCHAAWAVGRIAGSRAAEMCRAAYDTERDEEVRGELRAAIAASRRGGVYADDAQEERRPDSEENAR